MVWSWSPIVTSPDMVIDAMEGRGFSARVVEMVMSSAYRVYVGSSGPRQVRQVRKSSLAQIMFETIGDVGAPLRKLVVEAANLSQHSRHICREGVWPGHEQTADPPKVDGREVIEDVNIERVGAGEMRYRVIDYPLVHHKTADAGSGIIDELKYGRELSLEYLQRRNRSGDDYKSASSFGEIEGCVPR